MPQATCPLCGNEYRNLRLHQTRVHKRGIWKVVIKRPTERVDDTTWAEGSEVEVSYKGTLLGRETATSGGQHEGRDVSEFVLDLTDKGVAQGDMPKNTVCLIVTVSTTEGTAEGWDVDLKWDRNLQTETSVWEPVFLPNWEIEWQ